MGGTTGMLVDLLFSKARSCSPFSPPQPGKQRRARMCPMTSCPGLGPAGANNFHLFPKFLLPRLLLAPWSCHIIFSLVNQAQPLVLLGMCLKALRVFGEQQWDLTSNPALKCHLSGWVNWAIHNLSGIQWPREGPPHPSCTHRSKDGPPSPFKYQPWMWPWSCNTTKLFQILFLERLSTSFRLFYRSITRCIPLSAHKGQWLFSPFYKQQAKLLSKDCFYSSGNNQRKASF